MLTVLELLFIILMKLSKYLRALVELRSGVKLAVIELEAWSALKNSYECCFKSCPRWEFNALKLEQNGHFLCPRLFT